MTQDEKTKHYVNELGQVLLTKDDNKLKAHMRKWNINIPKSDMIFQIMKHKAITGRIDLPIELRKKSKQWLTERSYMSFDDGELS